VNDQYLETLLLPCDFVALLHVRQWQTMGDQRLDLNDPSAKQLEGVFVLRDG
jgi:hypothetical protein